ncbi:type II toxin-antitoxin system prevent-host-death family antitoxin [Azospirillum brasilense]|nr:type II toxin-antitoxin system prevent-host-death family antitoxin [Azospirillum brasilense]
MGHISLYDAKTHLSGLVERAAAGEEFVIAKNGVPMAKLVPLPKAVSYPHLRAHGTVLESVCRLLFEKKNTESTDRQRQPRL